MLGLIAPPVAILDQIVNALSQQTDFALQPSCIGNRSIAADWCYWWVNSEEFCGFDTPFSDFLIGRKSAFFDRLE